MAKCPPSNIGDDLGGYVIEPLRLVAWLPIREVVIVESLGITRPKIGKNSSAS
jgi:hypothetical protein